MHIHIGALCRAISVTQKDKVQQSGIPGCYTLFYLPHLHTFDLPAYPADIMPSKISFYILFSSLCFPFQIVSSLKYCTILVSSSDISLISPLLSLVPFIASTILSTETLTI